MNELLKTSGWGGKSNLAVILVLFILLVIITSSLCRYGIEESEGESGILATYGFNLYNHSSYTILYSGNADASPDTALSKPPSTAGPGSLSTLNMTGPYNKNITIEVSYNVISSAGAEIGMATFRLFVEWKGVNRVSTVRRVSSYGVINVVDLDLDNVRIINA